MQTVHFYQIDPQYTFPDGKPAQTPFVSVLVRLSAEPVGVKLSMRLNAIRRLIIEKQKEIVEQRERLADLYAEKNDDGELIEGDQPGTIKVTKEYFVQNAELLATTFESPAILASELLGVPNLCANDLVALGDILIDDLTDLAHDKPAKPTVTPANLNGNAPAHAGRRRRRRRKNASSP